MLAAWLILGSLFASAMAARTRLDVLEGDTVRFLPAGQVFERDSVMGNQTITKCQPDALVEHCGQWIDVLTKQAPVDEVGSETIWEDSELVIKNIQRADAGHYKDPETPSSEEEAPIGEELNLEAGAQKISTDGNTVVTLIVHANDD